MSVEAETKRYRSYITRMSKWLAFELVNDESLVKAERVRFALISRGELAEFLDDGWAKRVFSDKDLFEDAGDGFFKALLDNDGNGPAEPNLWDGVRPGEDVYGATIKRAAELLSQIDHYLDLNPASRWMNDDRWQPVHKAMIGSMEYAKSRGIEKPLIGLQERAFADALVDNNILVQIIASWFLNTRMLTEAMGRFLAKVKGEEGAQIYDGELLFFRPNIYRDDDPEPPTPEFCLKAIRRALWNRGILRDKK